MDADEQQDSGIDGDIKPPRSFPSLKDTSGEMTNSSSRTSSVSSYVVDKAESEFNSPTKNTRDLNRKLELRIAKARGLYSQEQRQSQSLLPLQRILVPRKLGHSACNRESSPLVDWESDGSNESDEIEFFPRIHLDKRQRLTDTFSVDNFEMSDDDDLNLKITPSPSDSRWICCSSSNRCSLM